MQSPPNSRSIALLFLFYLPHNPHDIPYCASSSRACIPWFQISLLGLSGSVRDEGGVGISFGQSMEKYGLLFDAYFTLPAVPFDLFLSKCFLQEEISPGSC
jgi:hypothetical protein